MKRVLTLQDLSCFGKCSLTVALPVISAMGIECVPVPTTVLSAHTAFPDPYVVDLSEHIAPIGNYLSGLHQSFDGILTGYLASPAQVQLAENLIDHFPGCPLISDPAMADHGSLYPGLNPEIIPAMLNLCRKSSLAVPNITESCLMTGTVFPEAADENFCRKVAEKLLAEHVESVLITGMETAEGETGFYWADKTCHYSYSGEKIPRSCYGTGDVFAACLTGALMKGMNIPKAGALAAEMVRRCIANTPEDCWYGVAFEPELSWLSQQI